MSIRKDIVERNGLREPRVYEGTYEALDPAAREFLFKRFDLSWAPSRYVGVNALGQYVFKLHDSLQRLRGYQVRLQRWDRPVNPDYPKASTYMLSPDAPVQSFYTPVPPFGWHDSPVVLVEDPMSALKVAQAGLQAVALMGVALTMDKVREVATLRRPVIFAYDKDATKDAIFHIRTWGVAFYKTQLLMLERDIKDLPSAEVTELFQEWL
jgi:hypothetical protein